ncbi:Chaperone protein dnaJ 11, chloroplastic [Apostasia shenzhenica]|uniref:Chaperone protein dnaJ 11, chloroplastic n=1 Tax=Apostasia shenzhenica TaxID=1088818 RepID=A0A2I0A0U7_9ASPA|nr:Chaperone protein dnaJ 11, chloroplastic [Apostasia shenzhenica]
MSFAGVPSICASFAPTARRQQAVTAAMGAPASAVGRGLYGVLRVKETASLREIKAAYGSLAKRWHPDVAVAVGAGEFLEIQRAYATLSDPAGREMHDRSMGFPRGEMFRSPRRWETEQCW